MKRIFENTIKKQDGFFHEKLIVLPKQILDLIQENPLTSSLYLTDIGYFPNAKNHYRERSAGCEHHIFLFCVEGQGTISYEGIDIPLKKGQLIIIPRNTPHTYQADAVAPWSIYWFHFHGSLSSHWVDYVSKKNNQYTVTSTNHSLLIMQFDQMYSLLESGYSIDNLIHLSSLLSLFFSTIHYQVVQSPVHPVNTINPVLLCIEFMMDKITSSVSLDDLMKLTHLSKSYLISQFREQTGFSPIDYFIHLKIQKACNLLDTTRLTIKEIANQLDYKDPYYFTRIFSKTMGYSPRQYRKIHKG